MNYSQYFCNLDQEYLMATNTSLFNFIRKESFLGNPIYDTPPRDELTLTSNISSNTIEVSIVTNYIKKFHYKKENKYYHKSNIDAVILKWGAGSFFSHTTRSMDTKTFTETLIITRTVYL
jgi:hypothetical protein